MPLIVVFESDITHDFQIINWSILSDYFLTYFSLCHHNMKKVFGHLF